MYNAQLLYRRPGNCGTPVYAAVMRRAVTRQLVLPLDVLRPGNAMGCVRTLNAGPQTRAQVARVSLRIVQDDDSAAAATAVAAMSRYLLSTRPFVPDAKVRSHQADTAIHGGGVVVGVVVERRDSKCKIRARGVVAAGLYEIIPSPPSDHSRYGKSHAHYWIRLIFRV